ncbi:MAG: homoserine kinase, partial [Lentisphaeria bacterium]
MKFKISVPATSANIGPGFDVMGIAFDMFNRFTFEVISEGDLIITGCDEAFCHKDNLVYTTIVQTLSNYDLKVPALHIHIDGDLPICSGLGSSSTCIVAGIMAANELGKLCLSKEEILRLATLIEGHPDNVAPAILGGFVAAIIEDDLVYHHNYPISDKISFYGLIPNHRVSTEDARAILPKSYKLSDCIYNMSRVPLLVEGLETANEQLIIAGCKDKIHQKYRAQLIPDCDKIFNFVTRCGEATTIYISGAGPTLMAIVIGDDASFPKLMQEY